MLGVYGLPQCQAAENIKRHLCSPAGDRCSLSRGWRPEPASQPLHEIWASLHYGGPRGAGSLAHQLRLPKQESKGTRQKLLRL